MALPVISKSGIGSFTIKTGTSRGTVSGILSPLEILRNRLVQ